MISHHAGEPPLPRPPQPQQPITCLCPPSSLPDHMPDCLCGRACYSETHSPMHTIQFVICDCHNIAIHLSVYILYFFCDYNNKYKNIVLFSMRCIRRMNRRAMPWCLFVCPSIYGWIVQWSGHPVVVVVVVLFNLVVMRPNSTIEQDNSKQRNNNRWTQNVYIACILHCVSKKVPTFQLSVNLSNLNRFSKLLHRWKAYENSYKNCTTVPTSPFACCYTTLGN